MIKKLFRESRNLLHLLLFIRKILFNNKKIIFKLFILNKAFLKLPNLRSRTKKEY